MDQRSDMLKKYGGIEALHVEKDVSPTIFVIIAIFLS